MKSKQEIEQAIQTEMVGDFHSAEGSPKKAIHIAAATGAGICAALPIGLDAWGLRTCEAVMVICIASMYGEKLTIAAAKGVLASSFGQTVGQVVALSALEAANTAGILSPAAAYVIKGGVAVSLIEIIGHVAMAHYAEKAVSPNNDRITPFDMVCGFGLAADAVRLGRVVEDVCGSDQMPDDEPEPISFRGGQGISNINSQRAHWLLKEAEELERAARNLEDGNPVEASRKRTEARMKRKEAEQILESI